MFLVEAAGLTYGVFPYIGLVSVELRDRKSLRSANGKRYTEELYDLI